MLLLPWCEHSFETALGKDECLRRLASDVEPDSWNPFHPWTKTFAGEIQGDTFRIRRIPYLGPINTGFYPILRGEIVALDGERSQIRIAMRLTRFAMLNQAYMSCFLSILIIIGLCIYFGTDEASGCVITLGGLLFFLLSWLNMAGCFTYDVKRARKAIEDLLLVPRPHA